MPAQNLSQNSSMDALTLNLKPIIELTDEQFFQLCQLHELIRFEHNADGTLLLMPLVGGTTSIRNASVKIPVMRKSSAWICPKS
ncbi:Uma2 family endonuclease [Allocoleopsis sp.]|uniref:Uma2 family endonuclease n=1 Tax=Allocoleopsis sp. TaxID=3088169 RepID=UPI002FCF4909